MIEYAEIANKIPFAANEKADINSSTKVEINTVLEITKKTDNNENVTYEFDGKPYTTLSECLCDNPLLTGEALFTYGC